MAVEGGECGNKRGVPPCTGSTAAAGMEDVDEEDDEAEVAIEEVDGGFRGSRRCGCEAERATLGAVGGGKCSAPGFGRPLNGKTGWKCEGKPSGRGGAGAHCSPMEDTDDSANVDAAVDADVGSPASPAGWVGEG